VMRRRAAAVDRLRGRLHSGRQHRPRTTDLRSRDRLAAPGERAEWTRPPRDCGWCFAAIPAVEVTCRIVRPTIRPPWRKI